MGADRLVDLAGELAVPVQVLGVREPTKDYLALYAGPGIERLIPGDRLCRVVPVGVVFVLVTVARLAGRPGIALAV